MLFLILGPSSLPVMVTQPDERHANRIASVLEWFDRHRAYSIWFKWRRETNHQFYENEFIIVPVVRAFAFNRKTLIRFPRRVILKKAKNLVFTASLFHVQHELFW